jgi:hypothetical protein
MTATIPENARKLRMLTVTFEQEILPRELENFRGAIVEKIGLDKSEFFHNHNNTPEAKNNFHYRYPLIQYALDNRRPKLIFLENAIDEATLFFSQADWDMTVNGKPYKSSIQNIKASQPILALAKGSTYTYRLQMWQALNTTNYEQFKKHTKLVDKINHLQSALSGHIIAMASGLEYRIPDRFELEMTDLYKTYAGYYKGIKVALYDIGFQTDMIIPEGLGLGKGASIGYGRLCLANQFTNVRQTQEGSIEESAR